MVMRSVAGGRKIGAAFFITKPVDFDFLKAQLRQLMVSPA